MSQSSEIKRIKERNLALENIIHRQVSDAKALKKNINQLEETVRDQDAELRRRDRLSCEEENHSSDLVYQNLQLQLEKSRLKEKVEKLESKSRKLQIENKNLVLSQEDEAYRSQVFEAQLLDTISRNHCLDQSNQTQKKYLAKYVELMSNKVNILQMKLNREQRRSRTLAARVRVVNRERETEKRGKKMKKKEFEHLHGVHM